VRAGRKFSSKKIFMNAIKTWSLALAFTGLAITAQAAPIVGDIGFGSTLPATLVGGDFLTATALDFADQTNAIVNGGTATTGDFEAQGAEFTLARFFDFSFAPLPVGGADPVWTVAAGGFSFKLTSVTATRTATSLTLDGIGVVSSTVAGLDDNSGDFHFTMQGAGGISFTFSADTTAPSSRVPDGGNVIALLGASLAGLALVRRKFAL
jgi:hypothetical protein